MRGIKWLSFSLSAAALLFAGVSVTAQVVDVSECRAIEGQLERFACYEALGSDTTSQPAPSSSSASIDAAAVDSVNGVDSGVDREPKESSAPELANNPSPQTTQNTTEQEAMPDVESFGRHDGSRVVRGENGEFELMGKVAELRHYVPNMWLITLEDGQQWRQTTGRRYNLKVGDEVRIYPSGWGDNYRLSAKNLTAFIQVQRAN